MRYSIVISALLITTSLYSQLPNYQMPTGYCSIKCSGHPNYGNYISNVNIGTINKSSTYNNLGYNDFTTTSTALTAGSTSTISISTVASIVGLSKNVWIDYNRDGDFYDAGEHVISTNRVQGSPFVRSFNVPLIISKGYTRIRVVVHNTDGSIVCENPYYLELGEVEDYGIFLENCSGQQNINTGLIGRLPIENNFTWFGGNRTIVTQRGGVSFTTNRAGVANSACYFDGVDDYLIVPSYPLLKRYNSDYSISVWVNPSSFSSSYQSALVSNRGSGGPGSALVLLGALNNSNMGKAASLINGGGTSSTVIGSQTLTLGSWHHVVVTFKYNGANNNNVIVYINGFPTVFSTQQNVQDPGNLNTLIGFEQAPGTPQPYHFHGKMDEIRLYNKVLTDCEVRSLYNSPALFREDLDSEPLTPSMEQGIRLYPNPSNLGYIEIEGNSEKDQSYEVFDMSGRKVLMGSAGSRIEITAIPNGIYLIKLMDATGNILLTERVIKY